MGDCIHSSQYSLYHQPLSHRFPEQMVYDLQIQTTMYEYQNLCSYLPPQA